MYFYFYVQNVIYNNRILINKKMIDKDIIKDKIKLYNYIDPKFMIRFL